MANYEEAARKFAEALQASGMSADQAAKAVRSLADRTKEYEKAAQAGTRSVKTFSEAFNTYDKSLEKVGQSLGKVYEVMKTAFLGGTASAMVSRLGEFHKGLYDLSRQATATGQTFGMFSKTMEDMGKKTSLSREESAKFLKQVQDSTKGIRLMGTEISDLAKVLSDEFGPKLEDIQNGFKTLTEIQQKDISIFSRLREGMKGPEFGNYLTSMIMSHKLTREQADTLVRINRQKILGAQAVDEETKKLRQFQDVQQRFHRAFSDLAISLGKPLMEIFIKIAGPLAAFGEKLSALMEKSKGFASMVGGTAKILAWSTIAVTIVAAMSALASKLSAAFQLIKSVVGMGANLAPVKVWVMNSMGAAPGNVAKYIGGAAKGSLSGEAAFSGATAAKYVEGKGMMLAESGAVSAGTMAAGRAAGGAMMAGGASAAGGGTASGAAGAASVLGPIAIVVAALAALAAAIYMILENFEKIGEALGLGEEEINSVVSAYEEFKKELSSAFKDLWKQFISVAKYIGSAMVPLLRTTVDVMSSMFIPAIKGMAILFASLAQTMSDYKDKISGFMDAIPGWIKRFAVGSLMGGPLFGTLAAVLGGKTKQEEADAATKANLRSIEKTKEKEYVSFYAKEMGMGEGSVDKEALEKRAKKLTGHESLGAAANSGFYSGMMKTDVRLQKLGLDVVKNPAEAAVGIGKLSAIQAILNQELAQMKSKGASDKQLSSYKEDMEKKAVQGQTVFMSKAMKEALKAHTTDANIAQKNFAQADPSLRAMVKPADQAKAVELSKTGLDWATMTKEEVIALNEIYTSLSATISEANGMLSETADTMLSINGNTEEYGKYLGNALELNKMQYEAAKATADATKDNLLSMKAAGESELKAAQEANNQEAILSAKNKILFATKGIAEAQNNVTKAIDEEMKIRMKLINSNRVEVDMRESQIQLLESQLSLSKALYAGMGPTLAIQGQLLSTLDEQVASFEERNVRAKKEIEQMTSQHKSLAEIKPIQKEILENENKIIQAKMKQVELTKGLRDQYLEAITSFSQMEGAFSKFMITRESGVGEAMRNLGMQGGLGVGVKGAGAINPLMQWNAGGGVQFQPMQQMMNFFKQYQGAAGYPEFKGMVPFGGWAEGTPAGSSMLQGFNAGAAGKEQMNQMTHPGAGTGAGTISPEGPPLDGGLSVINNTLKAILDAITKQFKSVSSVQGAIRPNTTVLTSMATSAPTAGPVIPNSAEAQASGGGIRVNINVKGDSAVAIKKVVMEELDAQLAAIVTPTGGHARSYDPTQA